MLQPVDVRLHEVDRRLDAVGHIHHRQARVLAQEARVPPVGDGLVVDLDRVVGRAASGKRLGRHDAGVSQSPGVHAETGGVVVAQELAGDLGHTVHRRWFEHRLLGRVLPGAARAEHRYRTRAEHARQLQITRDLERVDEAGHVDVPGPHRVLLSRGRENGCKVHYRADVVTPADLRQTLRVGDVHLFERPGRPEFAIRPRPEVAGHDARVPVSPPQFGGKLGSDLAQGSRHQDVSDSFRTHSNRLSFGCQADILDPAKPTRLPGQRRQRVPGRPSPAV